MGEFDGLKDRLTDGSRYKTVSPLLKRKERKGRVAEILLGKNLCWFVVQYQMILTPALYVGLEYVIKAENVNIP